MLFGSSELELIATLLHYDLMGIDDDIANGVAFSGVELENIAAKRKILGDLQVAIENERPVPRHIADRLPSPFNVGTMTPMPDGWMVETTVFVPVDEEKP